MSTINSTVSMIVDTIRNTKHIKMQVLHMNKGDGETSYAKNSLIQRKIISTTSPLVEGAIMNILRDIKPDSIGVADLGCSSGPNCLVVVSEIIQIVCTVSVEMGRPVPELRMSLNDLPGNDFNVVLELLPELYQKLKQNFGVQDCYVSAVCGSFYGRLYPTKSLHFVHSSSSLHWLSQVPSSLDSNATIHLNKSKIYLSKTSPPSVVQAYQHQFQKDFSLFLMSRAQELVVGGHMVLSFMGRRCLDPCADEACFQWELLARALMSMALDGLIDEEKINSFNAPYYAPCLEEVKFVIEKDGSFVVVHLETFEVEWDASEASDPWSSGQHVAKTIRAVVEPMLESHFLLGAKMMDELFQRYARIVADCFSTTRLKYINLAFSIEKNNSSPQ